MTLALPYSSSSYGRRRHMQSLRSNANNFIHTLDIPEERYFFDDINFKTTNEPIISGVSLLLAHNSTSVLSEPKSIFADSVSFETTNALIGGEFSVYKLLSLKTRNGHIEPKIIARNDPKRTSDETKIVLISSNR